MSPWLTLLNRRLLPCRPGPPFKPHTFSHVALAHPSPQPQAPPLLSTSSPPGSPFKPHTFSHVALAHPSGPALSPMLALAHPTSNPQTHLADRRAFRPYPKLHLSYRPPVPPAHPFALRLSLTLARMIRGHTCRPPAPDSHPLQRGIHVPSTTPLPQQSKSHASIKILVNFCNHLKNEVKFSWTGGHPPHASRPFVRISHPIRPSPQPASQPLGGEHIIKPPPNVPRHECRVELLGFAPLPTCK